MGNCVGNKQQDKSKQSTDFFAFKRSLQGKIKHNNIQEFYDIKEVMGRGHFGTVKRATSKNANDQNSYAIKSMHKSNIECKIELLERELELLMTVNHRNIVKFYDVFEDLHYVHIVMELCTGGELFDQLISKGRYTEAEAAKIMNSLLSAVAHLHSLDIAHRDLKPENIMLSSPDENSDIKIIDFGLAKRSLGGTGINTVLGSSYYVAPEVLNNNYGLSCDIWSCGVILYMLLSGRPPFDGNSEMSIYQQILKTSYSTNGPEWERVSNEGKEFVQLLLNPDSKNRITAFAALEHRWLSMSGQISSSKIKRKVMKRLRQYIRSNKIVKETMNILIDTMSSQQIKQLNSIFQELDTDRTGFITARELEEGLKNAGITIKDEELRNILETANGSFGKLKYSNFLAMASDMKNLENTNNLWLAFKYFDMENRGYITQEDFSKALIKAGWKLNENEIHEVLSQYELENNDKIFFEQFCKLFSSISS